ncbi:Metallo-dependent phosphatase-like protein [Epithele typhae]|uniref:Metallo-dependent phosphatase-like protein n=1 Tax=Epithele typhae TaxID=378194 RepID=UPI00200727EE|nr:Metallo-dependent phosphatase-like protein [Epithele typhae]KAH9935239.1 Metallo-dependent phosphatase-like protein [Epithele typhae]
MLFSSLLALSCAALAARACPDEEHGHDHTHEHSRRAFPSTQLTPPSRPLVWGDLNVLHTTDSHGWLLGHQKPSFPEPNYSGTLGDFSSFVAHMKELALEKDVDLLLVDSGDIHDGTGLTDGFPPGGVDAHDSNKFLMELPYDIMAIGNHELYVYANTLDMFTNFVPKLEGRYLSSNVNISVFDNQGNNVSVPVGDRYRKFKTRKGRSVTSLGVIFNFTFNDVNTTVQAVEDMVKETWFADAIKEEPDLFLLVGHMPVVETDNWPTVFNAIRAVHPTTPMMIFGGHTHIRDCVQYDGRSMALESGRYMETVGFMSMDFDQHSTTPKDITFNRRYLDTNLVTYEACYHTQSDNATFATVEGQQITGGLNELAERFNLGMLFGTAPRDFTIEQAPYPSNGSSLSLFVAAMEYALPLNSTRQGVPAIMITNSGSQRFDVYSGPFTRNEQLTAVPYMDLFLYVPDVPTGVARQVIAALNKPRHALESRAWDEAYARGEVDMIYRAWLEEMDEKSFGPERRAAQNATLGYVTQDSCPGVGDDTLHTPLPFFVVPDFIGSDAPADASDSDPIDLVFVDFIEDRVLEILNKLQKDKTYTTADVHQYSNLLSSEVLGVYAEKFWN